MIGQMQMTLPVSTAAKRAPQPQQNDAAGKLQWDAGALNASDFLTLLVAELKNQDPFNPMDQREMIAQLAQLQTVAELRELNTKMDNHDSVSGQMIGLLGKRVWWEDPDGTVRSGRVQRMMQTPEGWQLMVDGRFVDWASVRGVGQ